MLSIRKRMALSFIFIIILTVIVLEAMIINIVRRNYYQNLEENLYSQIRVSCDLYYRYFSDASLEDNVLNNVDSFWKQTDAQVEITDKSGRVLMDSIGVLPPAGEKLPDVTEALSSGRGSWIGKVSYDSGSVMAVSCPLKSQEGTVGVLRFITSLRDVDKDVGTVSSVFIIIGIIVAIVAALISMLLSNSIVGPLKEVTGVAEDMASGRFYARSRKAYNDEIGKLSDTLNYMAEEIQKRDRLKNEFISSVSHELRTPLTSIKGWAVTLMEDSHADAVILKDGLQIIERESDRLSAMVEELLDFSRFVSGKVTVNKEHVNAAELMDQVYKQLLPRAVRDGIVFELACGADIEEMLTDANRLKQVFINVLDNSLKFTEPGGRVLFSGSSENGVRTFSVRDSGCGISPEELPYVKEKFFKGRNSKSGSGIGLSICDEIIGLLGGSFTINSGLDAGTEVLISFPADMG